MKKSYNGSKTIKIVNRGLKNGQKMYGVKDLSHIFTGVVLVIMILVFLFIVESEYFSKRLEEQWSTRV